MKHFTRRELFGAVALPLGTAAEARRREDIPQSAEWSQLITDLIPREPLEDERFSFVIVDVKGKPSVLLRKQLRSGRGNVTYHELDVARTAVPEAMRALECEVHTHPGLLSKPPSGGDIQSFMQDFAENEAKHRASHGAVIDPFGVWFYRRITDVEQRALTANHRVRTGNWQKQVEEASGTWGRVMDEKAKNDIARAKVLPEYLALRQRFAMAGIHIEYVSHDDARRDPCGARTLAKK